LLIFIAIAALARDLPMTFSLVDKASGSATQGYVVLPLEGTRHLALSELDLELTILYLDDGTELRPGAGSTLRFSAWSPGYVPVDGTLVVGKRGTETTIALEPMALESDDPIASPTLAAARAWATVPDTQPEREAEAAEAVFSASLHWIEQGTFDPRALQLCQMTAQVPDDCLAVGT
jgi:hypothetical protein